MPNRGIVGWFEQRKELSQLAEDAGWLHPDTLVWLLLETERDKPMWGKHRYQSVWVHQVDGSLRRYERELGPALAFPGGLLFQFWAADCYSVGEVMEIADRLREGKPPEDKEPADLIGEYRKEQEELRDLAAHRSVSGPALTIQR